MPPNRSVKQPNNQKVLNSSNTKWKPLAILYSGVAALIICTTIVAAATLINWRQSLDAKMVETSKNLALLFEKSLEGVIDTIDIGLLFSSHTIGEHILSEKDGRESINASITPLHKRISSVGNFGVANEHGSLIYRNHVNPGNINVADREYFIKLRNDPSAELVISRPVVGRVANKWIWIFARRIKKQDGTFGGVVLASIFEDEIRKTFTQLKLAPHSQMTLRYKNFKTVSAYPKQLINSENQISHKHLMQALVASPNTGSYIIKADETGGKAHTFSYHRNKKYGFLVNVGVSHETMLAGWYKSVWITAGLVAALVLASLWLLSLITRAWQQQEASLITIKSSEEKLASAQNYARLGYWEARKDGQRIWSEQMHNIFNIPHGSSKREEIWNQMINPEDRSRIKRSINNALHNGIEHFTKFKIQQPGTGEERWINCRGKPVFAADGSIDRVIGFVQDITEHEQIKLALQRSESRLEEVARQSRTYVWEIDTDGLYTYVSDVVQDVLGYSPQELVGEKHYYDFHPEEGRENFIRTSQEIIANRKKVFDFTAPANSKDGALVWLATTAAPMLDKHGTLIGYRGSDREITIRKKFEMELIASRNRLEQLTSELIRTQEAERKHLARELHDELGQKFTTLNLQLHRLMTHISSPESEHLFKSISNEIAAQINQVRTMSGSLRPPALDHFGLEISLNNLLKQQFEESNVKYTLEYVGLPKKLPEQLEITIYRIIQEAITNITRHANASHIVIEANSDESKREIEIIIRDNGVGFDANNINSPKLGSSGFGLMGMIERVHLLNGEIEFFSKPGVGTRIQVLIPLEENISV